MRSNKLEVIQELPKIQRLKAIPSISPIEDWQKGEIVNAIKILLLISYVNYDAMMIIEDGQEWTCDKALLINSYMLIVKRLFELVDDGYMMKKEFNQIKKNFKIKFDGD